MRHTYPIAFFFIAMCITGAPMFGQEDEKGVAIVPNQKLNIEGTNWLVAIGIDEYEDTEITKLNCCVNDAKAIYDFFIQNRFVKTENATLFSSDQKDALPTRGNILDELNDIKRKAVEKSTLIIHFSGHGFIDNNGNGFLLTYDSTWLSREQMSLSLKELKKLIDDIKSKRKVLFIDACRKDVLSGTRGASNIAVNDKLLKALEAAEGQAIFFSCKEGQYSHEMPEERHGVFTYFLLEGLRGKAKPDSNNWVTPTTLQEYLVDNVEAWCNKKNKFQSPWVSLYMRKSIPLAVSSGKPEGGDIIPYLGTKGIFPPIVTENTNIVGFVLVGITAILLAIIIYRSRRTKLALQTALATGSGPEPVAAAVAPPKQDDLARAQYIPSTPPAEQKPEEPAVKEEIDLRAAAAAAVAAAKKPIYPTPAPKVESPDTFTPTMAGEALPKNLERARLVFEGAEEGRKILILTNQTLAIGTRKFTKDPIIGLTVRLLPCRSKKLDPENWQRNLLISSPHVTIESRHDHFVIRDEEGSKNGASIIDISQGEDDLTRSVGDVDTVFVNQSMIQDNSGWIPGVGPTIEGKTKVIPKGEWTRIPERCAISLGQRVMVFHAQTFCSERMGLYTLRLRRVDNCPELEYIQLIRRAYIGSDPKCPIRARSMNMPRLAAALDHSLGQFSLVTGVDDIPILLNGHPLEKRNIYPITHASTIEIGEYRWRFEPAAVEDFTEI